MWEVKAQVVVEEEQRLWISIRMKRRRTRILRRWSRRRKTRRRRRWELLLVNLWGNLYLLV